MRILWVVGRRILPVNSGGRIRTAFTLRELQKRHEVVVLSAYRAEASDPGYEAQLAIEFPGSIALYSGPHEQPRDRMVRVLGGLLPGRPVTPRPPASRRVARELRRGRYDLAVFDFLDAAALTPPRTNVPCVLYEHNVESDLLADHAALAHGALGSLSVAIRARSLRNIERAALRRFDHTIAVSEGDAVRLRELAGHDRVTAVATGVDLDGIRATPLPAGDAPVVMFTGLMNWPPNVDAVTWFAESIWPRVLRDVPNARFRIVGRGPNAAVQRLASSSSSIDVTGEVPDIQGQLAEASVVAIPLRLGSGTRLKVYEAMAAGRPLVSTALGAAGLDVRDGQDILFAETEGAFAGRVIELLKDRAMSERFAGAAAATAARHGWDTAAKDVERVLESVIRE